jgi:hypothetical protein
MQHPRRQRLPAFAYIPGQGGGPDWDPLDLIKSTVPRSFAEAVPAGHPAVCYAIELYDTGHFWEAHEVLEAVWKAAPKNGRDRLALRALIQMANAALKQKMGQDRAQRRLIADALEALKELSVRHTGVAPPSLADCFEAAALSQGIEKTDHAPKKLSDHLRRKEVQNNSGEPGFREKHEI